ncbi:MAG: PspC domain-containing protein [Anaerolineales bacterium]|nr:PspC domain-containing protein [Anaerolineales bacterium]
MTRLTRSMIDRTFGGVCGGLGHTLGVNAWWVRIAFIALAIFTLGTGILIYLALWLAMPEQRLSELDQITFGQRRTRPEALVIIGFGVIVAGLLVLALNLGVLDNTNGGALLPFGVILLGLTLFAQQLRRVSS